MDDVKIWYLHYVEETGEIKGVSSDTIPFYEVVGGTYVNFAEVDPKILPANYVHHYRFIDGQLSKKSDAEISAYETSRWSKRRRASYPDMVDQLDKIFHDIKNGTLDSSGQFFNAIQSVKEQYPKPE